MAMYMFSCTPNGQEGYTKMPQASTGDIKDGKMWAGVYCQSCHQLPDPSLLPKQMWYTGVFPRMGPFLGITHYRGEPYARANDVDAKKYFPDQTVVDSAKWSHIIAYYISTAPEVMPPQKRTVAIIKNLPFFDVKLPDTGFLYSTTALTAYAKIDTTVTPHRAMVSDGLARRFLVIDHNLHVQSSSLGSGAIVDLNFQPNDILACSIGITPEANNLRNGEVRRIQIDHAGKISADQTPMFDKLARPIKTVTADLNGDGKPDYVISQFGNVIGDLSWMENKGNGQFEKHILRDKPGAMNIMVNDYNHDGKPDIWAQFAQGEEGVFLYTNKGKGQFDEREVLRFPPSYGSTSFDLVDFNHDGHPDILYTCGDNGDYTPVLKPYHGVYIFMNDGKNNFIQKYFYPINGCYKAIARDFTGDGKLDIATISFYPSSEQPEEAFIYFKNKGNLNFQPYSLPPGTPFQKSVVMDAGDLDGDGKPDLLLGNGYFTSDSTSTHKEPLFILLKNKTVHNED
jgi:hypothetical protein